MIGKYSATNMAICFRFTIPIFARGVAYLSQFSTDRFHSHLAISALRSCSAS
jgi:hypothetical protein